MLNDKIKNINLLESLNKNIHNVPKIIMDNDDDDDPPPPYDDDDPTPQYNLDDKTLPSIDTDADALPTIKPLNDYGSQPYIDLSQVLNKSLTSVPKILSNNIPPPSITPISSISQTKPTQTKSISSTDLKDPSLSSNENSQPKKTPTITAPPQEQKSKMNQIDLAQVLNNS